MTKEPEQIVLEITEIKMMTVIVKDKQGSTQEIRKYKLPLELEVGKKLTIDEKGMYEYM